MKNNKITLFIVLFLSVSFTSCTDWLTIKPEGETVLNDFWKSESQATSVLASCYKGLTTDACMWRMFVWGEVRSDNVVAGASLVDGYLYYMMNANISPTNAYADWSSFYRAINYCNTFLHFAPEVLKSDQNFTPGKLHALEAEALTIRALCYFYLVRAYNQVPLVLEPSITDEQNYYVAKSTERQVLDQIITDLTTAQQYAKVDFDRTVYNKGRVTLNTVNALLADVYLWDQQYAKCVEACDKVLADKNLILVNGEKMLTDVFYTGNSTESIFELQFDKDVQYNDLTNSMFGYAGNKFGQVSFPYFLTRKGDYSPFNYAASAVKESSKDIRETRFYGTTENGLGYSVYKYALSGVIENSDETVSPIYRSSAVTTNWIVYRLSDVMLMKAEALVQLNNTDADVNQTLKPALKLVNATYLRSNLTADSLTFANYSNKGSMEKLVLRERQRELLFEGKRWFDLMRVVRRNNDASAIMAYIGPKLTGNTLGKNKMNVMDALYMPVLKSEIEANPKLTQNPFYEDSNTSK